MKLCGILSGNWNCTVQNTIAGSYLRFKGSDQVLWRSTIVWLKSTTPVWCMYNRTTSGMSYMSFRKVVGNGTRFLFKYSRFGSAQFKIQFRTAVLRQSFVHGSAILRKKYRVFREKNCHLYILYCVVTLINALQSECLSWIIRMQINSDIFINMAIFMRWLTFWNMHLFRLFLNMT